MAAAIVGDTAVTIRGQEKHLRFPTIGREGPAVAENNRLSNAPVFVIDLGTVFCSDRAHELVNPLVCMGQRKFPTDLVGYLWLFLFYLAEKVFAMHKTVLI